MLALLCLAGYRTSRLSAWHLLRKEAEAHGRRSTLPEPSQLASGMVVVVVPPGRPQKLAWRCGVVLTVWKKVFARNQGVRAQLTHTPVGMEQLHSFRVALLESGSQETTWQCSGDSEAVMCPANSLALTLKSKRLPSTTSTFVCALTAENSALCDSLQAFSIEELAAVEGVAEGAGQKLLAAAKAKLAKDAKKCKGNMQSLKDTKDVEEDLPSFGRTKQGQEAIIEELRCLLRLDMPLGKHGSRVLTSSHHLLGSSCEYPTMKYNHY